MRNGIDCCNNPTLSFALQLPILIGWDRIVVFNKLLCEVNYFLKVMSTGVKICLT